MPRKYRNKSRKNRNHSSNNKTFNINLPLFVIPLKKEDKGLFGALNEKEMVDTLKQQLEKFPITKLPSKGKSKTTQITSILPEVIDISEKPALLVKASVFDSNLNDTYLNVGHNKSKIAKTSHLGGENYFILFYPRIEGQNSDKYVYTWLQVVYEDPSHSTGVATAVAKKIVQSKIQTEAFNVKLQSAIEDFKTIAVCPEVQVRLVSVSHREDNSQYPQYKQYTTAVDVKEETTYTFANMPQNKVVELLRDQTDNGEVIIHKKATFGKKEYHVKRERYDEAKEWKESVEQMFNSKYEVSKSDVETGQIFNKDFVTKVFCSVITNYLTNK